MEDNTYTKVRRFIEKYHMIAEGDLVAAAVSGGADSVCLLHLLWRLKQEVPYRLVAVHVNHLMRPDASEDAAYVKELCGQMDLPYFLKEVDMCGYASGQKLSLEEAGRILRYQSFEEVLADQAGRNETGKVAVAHNADDRAETMLFHMFRGSGMRGLRSIQPVRGTVIRPVLCLEREEIEAYLKEHHLRYCVDSTNEEDTYTRNKIRHHILPYARQEICQGTVAHMSELADVLSETEAYLDEQTKRLYEACAEIYGGYTGPGGNDRQKTVSGLKIRGSMLSVAHPVMVNRVLLYCLERLIPHRKDITRQHIADLAALMQKEGSKELFLPGGVKAYKEYDMLYLIKDAARAAEENPGKLQDSGGAVYEIVPPASVHIPSAGDFEFSLHGPESDLYRQIFCNKGQNIPENRYTKWFDYDKITTILSLRTRREGDYLTIDASLNTKSVKQYMINEKIPKIQRGSMYLLADGSHVMWIPGYRMSQYYKVDESTKRILQVSIRGGRNG
ncbi:MAG: tRNA lysidine(34) synthetase TilS [Lachnospiraceae bacterium]|nr:tRNA lysidine(34) synthetase TilS [Lachnospiraceae bacterium]